jgi:hypothetical protein
MADGPPGSTLHGQRLSAALASLTQEPDQERHERGREPDRDVDPAAGLMVQLGAHEEAEQLGIGDGGSVHSRAYRPGLPRRKSRLRVRQQVHVDLLSDPVSRNDRERSTGAYRDAPGGPQTRHPRQGLPVPAARAAPRGEAPNAASSPLAVTVDDAGQRNSRRFAPGCAGRPRVGASVLDPADVQASIDHGTDTLA